MDHRSPEDLELDQKRDQLTALEEELVTRELELTALRSTLRTFERRYAETVGVRLERLDRLQEALRWSDAEADPNDSIPFPDSSRAPTTERELPADLKQIYRQVARRVHPDLAVDDCDRVIRDRVMAEVNEAYGRGDRGRLGEILREWAHRPESVKGDDTAAQLVRTIRRIHQVTVRLKQISSELTEIRSTDLYALYQQMTSAEKEGAGTLHEIASRLDAEIEEAMLDLKRKRDEYRG